MIDDILEGFLKIAGSFLYKLLVEVMAFYAGEIILYLFSFGKKKPRWDYYAEDRPSRFVIFTEISTWVGFLFWLLVVAGIIWIFKAGQ